MRQPLSHAVTLVADAGEEAGLGHVSRSSAVAAALTSRGTTARCLAFGAPSTLQRHGVVWQPLDRPEELGDLPSETVLLLDSYRLARDAVGPLADSVQLAVMHDYGEPPEGAALVISAGTRASAADPRQLCGPAYACLGPTFWGLPRRQLGSSVDRVLIATGSGDSGGLGAELAAGIQEELPGARVAIVQAPNAGSGVPQGVEPITSPDSLAEELLASEVAITAAGVTMLEAAATGTPCIAMPVAENQRAQAETLADSGAVRLAAPSSAEVAHSLRELAASADLREDMSRRGQDAIDGYGALRVAFQIASLAARGEAVA
jgi:UDP-2,4-diacetamido-2,4,6-trideoxy-beta-L-altropyranose hydrolase